MTSTNHICNYCKKRLSKEEYIKIQKGKKVFWACGFDCADKVLGELK